jgi:hypothetical protein
VDELAALVHHNDAFLHATMPVPSELCGNRHGKRAGSLIVRKLLDCGGGAASNS